MIRENRIIFGYGSVLTGRDGALTFEYIQPSAIVGESVKISEYEVLDRVRITVDRDFFVLRDRLKELTPSESNIEFRGYILDFSNFNLKSIEIVLKAVNSLIFEYYNRSLAC